VIGVREFLARVIEPAVSPDQVAAKRGRELSKWIFDLARNLIVLGGLKYFSEKTGSAYVLVGYYACSIAFVLYVMTYWQVIYLRFFSLISRNRATELTDLALNVMIGVVIALGGTQIVSIIANEIARAQLR